MLLSSVDIKKTRKLRILRKQGKKCDDKSGAMKRDDKSE